jgi:hypothetical protein
MQIVCGTSCGPGPLQMEGSWHMTSRSSFSLLLRVECMAVIIASQHHVVRCPSVVLRRPLVGGLHPWSSTEPDRWERNGHSPSDEEDVGAVARPAARANRKPSLAQHPDSSQLAAATRHRGIKVTLSVQAPSDGRVSAVRGGGDRIPKSNEWGIRWGQAAQPVLLSERCPMPKSKSSRHG